MLRSCLLIVSIVCHIFSKLPKTTWNPLLNSNKVDREWLVRASYNNIEAWAIYYPCSACETDSNECSAGSVSLNSGTQGHGLDQDPVIEGFGLWCVCLIHTHHRPHTPTSGSWSSGWTECQWCLRATVHTLHAGWIPLERCTPQTQAINQYLLIKVLVSSCQYPLQ